MKHKVVYSTRFRKDWKRYQHDTKRMRELFDIVRHLEDTGCVPVQYRPHKLHGIYEGCL